MTRQASIVTPADRAQAETLDQQYQAQLLGDQLSAEFHSPLNSQNRQRKLRRAKSGATLWQEPEQERLL